MLFSWVCVNLGFTHVCLHTSSYLTVLNSLAEKAVHQQVLQLGVSVKRLFDLTQEYAMRGEGGNSAHISTVEYAA